MNRSAFLVATAACCFAPFACATQAPPSGLVVSNVTVVSPERATPLEHAYVRILDGKIAELSERPLRGETQIDGTGRYLAPGLIDSHVHLGAIPGMRPDQEHAHPDIARAAREQIPRSYLYFGFTTLVDLNSTPEAMARWKIHDPAPDTYFCGAAALIDAYPMVYTPKPARYKEYPYMLVEPQAGAVLPPGVEAAQHSPQTVVAHMKADGAICVKTFFERGFGDMHDLPVPQPQTIRALVGAAHSAGLPVLMHANSAQAQTFGLDTGVDILAHGLWSTTEQAASGVLTPAVKSILDRVVQTNIGWQPTMQVMYGLKDLLSPEFLSDPKLAQALPRSLIEWYGSHEGQWYHDGAESVAKTDPAALTALTVLRERVSAATGYLAQRDARLLFGSDTPSGPIYTNPPGLNGRLEMNHWIAAGVSEKKLFHALTIDNARMLHLDDRIGTVEPGKAANLLLLRASPLRSVEAYDTIETVFLHGHPIPRAELSAVNSSGVSPSRGRPSRQ
jgi:imidazolonepropionase-like amidohydrolase